MTDRCEIEFQIDRWPHWRRCSNPATAAVPDGDRSVHVCQVHLSDYRANRAPQITERAS